MPAKKPIHLDWVTTLDHDEDWFIFAPTSRSAASCHEDCEGYDSGDANPVRLLRPSHTALHDTSNVSKLL
jgi:hypothetical protein